MNIPDNCRIAAFTRKASDGYSAFMGDSVHFALSLDGGVSFMPLGRGRGMLFPKCYFDENNGIISAGVKDIEISLRGGVYIISGKELVRRQIKEHIFTRGFDIKETGKYVRWSTKDFISFSEPEVCETRLPEGAVSETESESAEINCSVPDIAGAVSLPVSGRTAEGLLRAHDEVRFSHIKLPRHITAKKAEDIEKLAAKVMYTDGSCHVKRIEWDLSGVDFGKAGKYTARGRIQRRHFPFPVQERPWGDPVIKYFGGKYYFIGTDDRGHDKMYEIREADTPEVLFLPDVKRSVLLDTSSYNGRFDSTFWAPEFHITAGKMRIFGALGQGDFNPQCHVMTLRDGGDMLCPADWSEPVRCVMPDGRFISDDPLGDGKKGITLDMTYFEAKGKSYLVWSYRTWEGTDSGSMLMIAQTDPEKPWQLVTYPLLLSRPEYGWENVDGTDNNEGPYAIVTEDTVYLAYSGGNAIGDSYAVGMLTADVGADLTDVSVWSKSTVPALATGYVEGQYGPGHNAFFTDEYGDTYITYHGHTVTGNSDRLDGVRRVHFTAGGAPLLSMSEERDIPEEQRNVALRVTVEG